MAQGKLLLVEDEPMIAFLLEDIVTELGYEVGGVAGTLSEALALAEVADALDAAILDVNLAGLMSYPAAEKLVSRDIPVILVTGYAAHEPPPSIAHLKVLRKPYDSAQIAAALAEVCGRQP